MIRRLQRILIANRGEVVQSITKSLHEMGREAIAVYELPDSETLFIRRADAAIPIGAGPLTDYLNSEKIIRAAKEAGADAIHPGYGFLSESAEFAAACRDNGLVFIGPPPEVMRRLGDKVVAKEMMRQERIVTIPGTEVLASGPAGVAEALAFAEAVGYPILLLEQQEVLCGRSFELVVLNAKTHDTGGIHIQLREACA